MTKPQFTPGPWDIKDKYTILGKDAVKDALMGNDPSICHICTVNGWLVSAEANAALIAAAPEMYALLEELATCGAIPNGAYVERINNLLAKCRGENTDATDT